MMPADTDQENEKVTPSDEPVETAPDSETQSSAASAQGNRNNPELSRENTGRDASHDKAEGE